MRSIWTEYNDMLRVFLPLATFACQRDHAGDPTGMKKRFSVRSWIARELSALRGPWCSLSRGHPTSWWCAGVLFVEMTVFKDSSHLSFRLCFTPFLMMLLRESCVWLHWCSACDASTALSTMPLVHVSIFDCYWGRSWPAFLPLLLLNFLLILVFSSLIILISLHLE